MAGTNVFNDYVAGAIGGCAGMTVGHPLDTVKVQMQTQPYHNQYKGLWDCITTISHEGLSKGFFRGLSWPLISYGFLNSIFFGMYGHLLQVLGHNERETLSPHIFTVFTAGVLATTPTVLIACPIEVIKVTMQSQIKHETFERTQKGALIKRPIPLKFYKGPLEAVIDIYKTSGHRGIFRGFWTQMGRDSPGNAIYMISYEVASFELNCYLPNVPAQAVNFVCGGVAGVLSWVPIMPFDVIKSRMQADTNGDKYKGFWDCALKSYQLEGYKVFFKGTMAVVLRAFPVNAVTLMVYTDVLKWMNEWNV